MNLYDNSSIDCKKKIKKKYMICIIILLLINSFKFVRSLSLLFTNKVILLLFINKLILLLIHIRSSVILDN